MHLAKPQSTVIFVHWIMHVDGTDRTWTQFHQWHACSASRTSRPHLRLIFRGDVLYFSYLPRVLRSPPIFLDLVIRIIFSYHMLLVWQKQGKWDGWGMKRQIYIDTSLYRYALFNIYQYKSIGICRYVSMMRSVYKILVEEPQKKRPIKKNWRMWKKILKTILGK